MASLVYSDPARLSLIRRPFLKQVRSRYAALRKLIREEIGKKDVLGLDAEKANILTPRAVVDTEGVWAGVEINATSADPAKLADFKAWLVAAVKSGDVKLDKSSDWAGTYVESSYKKGVLRSYLEATKRSKKYNRGTNAQFLASFNTGELLSKAQFLATRSYENLDGVTKAMESRMNLALAKGILDGKGAKEIQRELLKVTNLSESRAMGVVQNELIAAHAEGQLDSMENLGIPGVSAVAEFLTVGDDRVCPQCKSLEGKVFTTAQARGIIPVHWRCRCIWMPAV